MTIPTEQDEKFVNDVYKAVMGESVIEKIQKIEQEKQKIEQEKQKIEQEKQKIEQEKQKAELKAEKEKYFAIRNLILLKTLSDEQIAETFSISVEDVIKIKNETEN